jgi:hypothetical protein
MGVLFSNAESQPNPVPKSLRERSLRPRREESHSLVYLWLVLTHGLPFEIDRDVASLIAYYCACLADPYFFATQTADMDAPTYLCFASTTSSSASGLRPIPFREACVHSGIPAYRRCESWLLMLEWYRFDG